MKNRHPLIRTLVVSVLAGLVVASAGMASAGHLAFFQTSASKATVSQDSTTCGQDDQGTSDDQGGSQDGATLTKNSRQHKASDECDDAEQGATDPGDGGDGNPAPVNPADREAECNAAAGVSTATSGGSDGSSDGTQVKTMGLDHAIEVVLANCIKNPQSQGLLNALRHLMANRDRHLAHQAEKDARRSAREAAKLARRSALGHGK